MLAIKHFGIVTGYGALAVSAAIAIPIWIPSAGVGLGVGTALFVLAALVHHLVIKRNRELALQQQIDILLDGCSKLAEDFNRLQKRYDQLLEGPGEFAPDAFDHQRRLRRVQSELRVLRTLKNQASVSEDSASVIDNEAASAQRSQPDLPAGFSEAQMLHILREALKHERIDLFLQPVVTLPQRTPRYYECYSRIRAADGSRVKPAHYIEFAKERGLLGGIDNMLLFRCIQLVRKAQRHNHNLGFFCNISVQTIEDRKFFPHFIAFLAENRNLASRLTFELGQGDIEFQWDSVAGNIEQLTNLGYRLSLDGVKNLGFDAAEMAYRHFAFVKVEAQTLLSRAGDSGQNVRRFKQELGRNGIELIAEKVETQQQLMELLDLDICFAQGFLFGEPRLSRSG